MGLRGVRMSQRVVGSVGPARRRVGLSGRMVAIAVAASIGSVAFGCVSARVKDFDTYVEIPMNKVVPYPSAEQRAKRAFRVGIIERAASGIDETRLVTPRAQVRKTLETLVDEAGAGLAERAGGRITGADFGLATRFSRYNYASEWKPPFKFLWQTPEDIAEKPGTCTHRTEVELDVEFVDLRTPKRDTTTYTLSHAVEERNKDVDSACTIEPETLATLFETALDEALSCLNVPLGTRLAPRGHVTAHRKAPEGERHIYRISIGADHGVLRGDRLEIRRVQLATSPTGEQTRSERVIATAVVTDQISPQMAWVAVDPAAAAEPLLDGDIVRPLLAESLLSDLSGPNCARILSEG